MVSFFRNVDISVSGFFECAPLYKWAHRGDSGAIDIFGVDWAMRISVLALKGLFDTGLTTVVDALAMANTVAQWTGNVDAGL